MSNLDNPIETPLSPWNPPPEGTSASTSEFDPITRDPQAKLLFSRGSRLLSLSSVSHERLLETLSDSLIKEDYQLRTNGEDFIFFASPFPRKNWPEFLPLFLQHLMTSIEGTFVLTSTLNQEELRLSELPAEAQNFLHEGKGGFDVSYDYVVKRNFKAYALLILFLFFFFSLFMAAVGASFVWSFILALPLTFSTLILEFLWNVQKKQKSLFERCLEAAKSN